MWRDDPPVLLCVCDIYMYENAKCVVVFFVYSRIVINWKRWTLKNVYK